MRWSAPCCLSYGNEEGCGWAGASAHHGVGECGLAASHACRCRGGRGRCAATGQCWPIRAAQQLPRAAAAAAAAGARRGVQLHSGRGAPRQAKQPARTQEGVGHGVRIVALAGLARHHEHAAAALQLLQVGRDRSAAGTVEVTGCVPGSKSPPPGNTCAHLSTPSTQLCSSSGSSGSRQRQRTTHVLQLHARPAELPDLCDVVPALAQHRADLHAEGRPCKGGWQKAEAAHTQRAKHSTAQTLCQKHTAAACTARTHLCIAEAVQVAAVGPRRAAGPAGRQHAGGQHAAAHLPVRARLHRAQQRARQQDACTSGGAAVGAG